MIEIKTIGRGGQGAVTFSQILAIAAFEEGYPVVQAMPSFGVERRGAPSFSFTRLSKEQCFGNRSLIYAPDMVVVLDPTLMKEMDVTDGLKKNGLLIVNTKKEVKAKNCKIVTADASSIALKLFKKDIVNTAMLGAFAAATESVSLESLFKGVEQRFQGDADLIEKNKQAIKEVYNSLKK